MMGNKYRKPFLKEVIARLDFVSPVSIVKKTLPRELTKVVLPIFPISEPREFIAKDIQVSPKETKEKIRGGIDWLFHGEEREKTICINPSFIFISYRLYDSFNSLKNNFFPVVETLFEFSNDLQVNRFGLRYINTILLQENNAFDWDEYLNKKLLTIFEISEDKSKIRRAFHNLTLKDDDTMLVFQYGMHNPDFPASITKKNFVLDYDAYSEGLLDMGDIKGKIDIFHDKIENVPLEASINIL
jgi:uncharacterized protein (TIGR04255 family)